MQLNHKVRCRSLFLSFCRITSSFCFYVFLSFPLLLVSLFLLLTFIRFHLLSPPSAYHFFSSSSFFFSHFFSPTWFSLSFFTLLPPPSFSLYLLPTLLFSRLPSSSFFSFFFSLCIPACSFHSFSSSPFLLPFVLSSPSSFLLYFLLSFLILSFSSSLLSPLLLLLSPAGCEGGWSIQTAATRLLPLIVRREQTIGAAVQSQLRTPQEGPMGKKPGNYTIQQSKFQSLSFVMCNHNVIYRILYTLPEYEMWIYEAHALPLESKCHLSSKVSLIIKLR